MKFEDFPKAQGIYDQIRTLENILERENIQITGYNDIYSDVYTLKRGAPSDFTIRNSIQKCIDGLKDQLKEI